MIAGVCGGLADYFGVDPSLVRVAFVVGTLWAGLGVILYVILAIVVPAGDESAPESDPRPERTRAFAAGVLILAGSLFLASNLGWAPWLTWDLFWPTMLIVAGGALMWRGPGVPRPRE